VKQRATVTLKFRIDHHGAVAKASAAGLPGVSDCIAAAIKALVFDTPDQGAIDVTTKLSFQPATVGILGSTSLEPGGAFASLTGTGDVGLFGNEAGENHGSAGFGRRGVQAPVLGVTIGQPSVQGDLDRAIIRRYIKRNLQNIQSCYEKQLLKAPRLAGTVEAEFTIGADGKVTASTATGVDAAVASCVADVIQQIEFPKPKNNSVASVKYPLVFRPGSDDRKP
jgi:hypothetical protein